MENFFFSRNFLMVYAIILLICNPLYTLKVNAEELIISEKSGFSSTFEDKKGNQLTLENFAGNLLLVNLWATWCEPCKEEMPSLELLQNQFNEDEFLVLPINLDRGPKKNAINFFKDQNIINLDIYFDDKNEIPREVKILGLPVSIFISKDGREISRLIGPAKWDDEYFIEYIKENLF